MNIKGLAVYDFRTAFTVAYTYWGVGTVRVSLKENQIIILS